MLNASVLDSLIELEKEGHIPTAMAFVGPKGVGQKQVAKSLLKYLLCEKKSGCGSCGACLRVEQESSEALQILEPQGEWIKVDQIHEVLKKLSLRSISQKRFVIIDEAEKLNPQSSNALLKVLEEPPQDTHFILITSGLSSLLPTIRSRVQSFRFHGLTFEELKRELPDSAPWILNLSRGQVSEAEEWQTEEMGTLLKAMEEALFALSRKDLEGWVALLQLVRERTSAVRMTQVLQYFFKDLAYGLGEGEQSLPFTQRLRGEFEWSLSQLSLAWEKAFEMELAIQRNADRPLIFQNYFFEVSS